MDDVFARLHRLRRARELQARSAHARAVAARDDAEAELHRCEASAAAVLSLSELPSASSAQDRSVYLLQTELRRREGARLLDQRTAEADSQADTVRAAAREARVAERVVEIRHERRIEQERAQTRRAADELGLLRWARRTA